jgi:hypothetical protein
VDEKKAEQGSGSEEVFAPEGELIKAEFSRRWVRQVGISGQVLIFGLPFLVSPNPPTWGVGLALTSVVLALLGSLWNWRCPHCSKYFGKKFFFLKFCPNCGVELV